MTAAVTSSLNAAGVLRVYINDVLHLSIATEKLVEVQSWKMTTRRPPLFAIERTYSDGASQFSDYDDEALWKAVLTEIDAAFGAVRSTGADR